MSEPLVWTGLILCFSHLVSVFESGHLICGQILQCRVCCRYRSDAINNVRDGSKGCEGLFVNLIVMTSNEPVYIVRYHRMMQSRVKPLHSKVADTSAAVDQAEGKLAALASKHKDLEERLQSLAHAYEEACIDKCRQFELAQTLQSQLQQAAHFEEVGVV